METANPTTKTPTVALRKESVDRNASMAKYTGRHRRSLSARRAWIEIPDARPRICGTFVALRKESVDRNLYFLQCLVCRGVALRKESVDRNIGASYGRTAKIGRSPQGERG